MRAIAAKGEEGHCCQGGGGGIAAAEERCLCFQTALEGTCKVCHFSEGSEG